QPCHATLTIADDDAPTLDLELGGLDEDEEEDPGLILGVNDDFYESNRIDDTEEVDWDGTIHAIAVNRAPLDNELDHGRQARILADEITGIPEGDIVLGVLTIGGPEMPGTLEWTIPDGVIVYWQDPDLPPDHWIPVPTTTAYFSGTSRSIAVEG